MKFGPDIKRVALFADLLSEIGGVQYYIFCLAKSLKRHCIDVRVYSGTKPQIDHWINLFQSLDIPLIFSEMMYESRSDRKPEYNLVKKLEKIFGGWRPDIIHTCPMGKLSKVWLEHKLSSQIPIIATEMTTPGPDTRHWYSTDLYRKVNRFDAIIAWSKKSSMGVKKNLGYTKETYLIPHFIPHPTTPFDFVARRHIPNMSIGCISRLSPEKGIDYLIAAMSFIIKRYPTASVHIYGHGREEEHLKYIAKCFGIENNIIFEGIFEPIIGIDRVARRHSIFVQPSLFESISVAVLELMARKRVLIVTKVGGNQELFEKSRAALLVDRGDSKALARAMLKLFDYPNLQAKLSHRAYQKYMSIYKDEDVLQKHLQVYEACIQRKP